jgi:SAM-dependent methyltransferase
MPQGQLHPRDQAVPPIWGRPAESSTLDIIVFSKDRACQLDALLRSMREFFGFPHRIHVLYTTSTAEFELGYDLLRWWHRGVNWVGDNGNFGEAMRGLMQEIDHGPGKYLMFLVDDMMFTRPFTAQKLMASLDDDDDILAVSLRMGETITYCYVRDIETTPPDFSQGYRWSWKTASPGYWNYPMSQDAHIFRTGDFAQLIPRLRFVNPNTLEAAQSGHPFPRPDMVCEQYASVINVAANRVQSIFKNRCGNISAEFLNESFLAGFAIDVGPFTGRIYDSCHVDEDLPLIEDERSRTPPGIETIERDGRRYFRVDLREVPTFVLNCKDDEKKRLFQQEQLTDLGLQFEFIRTLTVNPGWVGVALGHLKALRLSRARPPFLVLEDDCVFNHRFEPVIEVPVEAEALYLGSSIFGIEEPGQMSWGRADKVIWERHSPGYLRVHNMLARHAVLYLDPEFQATVIESQVEALTNRHLPHMGDIGLARLQAKHLTLLTEKNICRQLNRDATDKDLPLALPGNEIGREGKTAPKEPSRPASKAHSRGHCHISHKHRFIFFRIAKNASSTMRGVLRDPALEVETVPIASLDPKTVEEYFTFTFLRDPINRLLSAYQEVSLRDELKDSSVVRKPFMDLGDGIERFRAFLSEIEQGKWDVHTHDQTDLLHHIPMDFYGRVESLQADLQLVFDRLGLGELPVLLQRRSREGRKQDYGYDSHYLKPEDLAAEDIDRILELYKDDVDLLLSCCPAPPLVAGTGPVALSSQARARAMEEEESLTPVELFKRVNREHDSCVVYCLGDRGFYAELTTVARAMIYAWDHGRQLLLDSRGSMWAHEQGWEDYFESFCGGPDDVDPGRILERIEFQPGGKNRDFNRLRGYMPKELSFGRRRLKDFQEILAFFTSMIFQPTSDCQAFVDRLTGTLNLPAEYDAIHLRRGDKVGDEDVYYPVGDYIQRLGDLPPGRTLFVMSDSWAAVQEVRDFLASQGSAVRVVSLVPRERTGFDVWKLRRGEAFMGEGQGRLDEKLRAEYVRDNTRELIAETLVAARSKRFVSTWRSNVGRTVWFLHSDHGQCTLLQRSDSSAPDGQMQVTPPSAEAYHWADDVLRKKILGWRMQYVRANAGFRHKIIYCLGGHDLLDDLAGLARAMMYAFSRQRQLLLDSGSLKQGDGPHWHELVQPLVPVAGKVKPGLVEARLSMEIGEGYHKLRRFKPDRLSFGSLSLRGFDRILGFFLQLLLWPAAGRRDSLASLMAELPLDNQDYDALCLGGPFDGSVESILEVGLATLQPVSADRPLYVMAHQDKVFTSVSRSLAANGSQTRALGLRRPPGLDPLMRATHTMAELAYALRARRCVAGRDDPFGQAVWLMHPRREWCQLVGHDGVQAPNGTDRFHAKLQLRNGRMQEFELPSGAPCLPLIREVAAGAHRAEFSESAGLLQIPLDGGTAAMACSVRDISHVSLSPVFDPSSVDEWLPPVVSEPEPKPEAKVGGAPQSPRKAWIGGYDHPALNLDEEHLGGYMRSRHPEAARHRCENGDPATYVPRLWDWMQETLGVRSVLDIGCGEGHAAAYLHRAGCKVMAIDGSVQAERDSVIPRFHHRHDYVDGPFIPQGSWDAVWCCEFVEHVEEKYTHHFLATFASARRYVIMTFAGPGQLGFHHVNCQPEAYWVEKLRRLGFQLDDKLTARAREVAGHGHFKKSGLVFVRVDPERRSPQEPDQDDARAPEKVVRGQVLPVNPMPLCEIEGHEFLLFLDIFVHPDRNRIVAVMPWYNDDWDPARQGIDFEQVHLVYRGRKIQGTWIPHRLDSWEPCALLDFEDPLLERWLKKRKTISFHIEAGPHRQTFKLSTQPPPAYRVLMSLVIKDENRWVRHFLEYYLECLKADHVLVYDNHTSNRAELRAILDPYIAAGKVSYIPWDFRWRNINAPRKMIAQPQQESHSLNRFANSRWIGFLDVDEFLRIPGKTLPEFLDAYNTVNVDGLSFGIRWFQYEGALDFDEIVDAPLTFRRSHPSNLGRKRQKFLVSPHEVRFLRLHTLEEGGRELQVDDTDIYFHHYCQSNGRFKNKDHENSVTDDYMLRFIEELSLDGSSHRCRPKPKSPEEWVQHITSAIAAAECHRSKLDEEALSVEGYCGALTRHFYNNLCNFEGCGFLEIGSWNGASTVAAMAGNEIELTCIDNFTLFRGNQAIFRANVERFMGDNKLTLLAEDCFEVDTSSMGPFDVYLYDGGHTYQSHYRAIERYISTLAPLAVLIVDDWNWERVRNGTQDALRDLGVPVLYRKEILLPDVNDPETDSHDPEKDGWWNGICIMLVGQPESK